MSSHVLKRILFLLFSANLTTGCFNDVETETVFPKESASCEGQKIPGQYVVEWANGEVTLEYGQDRESFKESFVAPNVDRIKLVEQNKSLFVDPIEAHSARFSPTSEPSFDNWGAVVSEADVAWAQGIVGAGIVVAVIDTGVDYTHPQLSQQIAVNENEIPNNNRDDDNNGYIDDYYGYNFATDTNDPFDGSNHGTHVAGTIAAEHHDVQAGFRSYVQGVAPGAKVLPISFLDSVGRGSLEAAVRAIDYAISRKVDIINASWGGAGCSPMLASRIERLAKEKIIFVAASGNQGVNIDRLAQYPASYNMPAQITVGAISSSGITTDFSNYGLVNVHIFAPGKDISSTTPFDSYATFSGTSMATPHVSGALALLKSKAPHAGVAQLKKALLDGVSVDSNYLNSTQGRLNIAKALSQLN